MAAYNKTLGRFNLTGIPPAPRGVPQIEVKFDIDRNGIVHVSAKDLGTGNEQNITITASSNLSDEDIDKAVKEAEKFAAEDKAKKEEVEIRNQADTMVYQCEKALGELGDKVDAAEKDAVNEKIQKTKDAIASGDVEKMKAATEELTTKFNEIAQKLYAQAAPQQDPNAAAGGTNPNSGAANSDPNVVDADYKVVDDDDNK